MQVLAPGCFLDGSLVPHGLSRLKREEDEPGGGTERWTPVPGGCYTSSLAVSCSHSPLYFGAMLDLELVTLLPQLSKSCDCSCVLGAQLSHAFWLHDRGCLWVLL